MLVSTPAVQLKEAGFWTVFATCSTPGLAPPPPSIVPVASEKSTREVTSSSPPLRFTVPCHPGAICSVPIFVVAPMGRTAEAPLAALKMTVSAGPGGTVVLAPQFASVFQSLFATPLAT